MRRSAVAAILVAVILLDVSASSAQSSDELGALRREFEALKAGQEAMRKELEEIRSLLSPRAAAPAPEPEDIVLSINGAPANGHAGAKLVLIDFSDYQCPFCARHVRETLPRLQREYIDTGKIRYVSRDFPLESIHRQAFKAAEAAHCAGEQKDFWAMSERLFANQRALAPGDLPGHAQALKLDLPAFQSCLASGKYAQRIRQDLADGRKAGVTGTPSFFMGVIQPDGSTVKVLRVLKGAQSYAAFKAAIDILLAAPQ